MLSYAFPAAKILQLTSFIGSANFATLKKLSEKVKRMKTKTSSKRSGMRKMSVMMDHTESLIANSGSVFASLRKMQEMRDSQERLVSRNRGEILETGQLS